MNSLYAVIDARLGVVARARGVALAYVMAFVVSMLAIATFAAPAYAQILGTVTQQRNLSFGTILTGTSTTVLPTAAGAAMWKVHGAITIGGGFSFTLPNTLSRTGGGATLPITFSSTSAIYRTTTANPVGGNVFNPASGQGFVIAVATDIYIWLGATVNPPLNQKAGTYTGTVVFTVAGLL